MGLGGNSHGEIGEQQYALYREKHSKVVHRQEFQKAQQEREVQKEM